ncbi:MAG: purine-nucleoside phosphorylase, partial [Rhizobiaceae bacterium]|nr:purine-nucleoside phosphorylase [Rhizobiaceae bacterium]
MEVIAANHIGMRVLGLSAVANGATGGPDQQVDTVETVAAGAAISGRKIEAMLRELFPTFRSHKS